MPSATRLMCVGPAVQTRALLARVGVDVQAELGGDHHLVADRGERLADELLVRERAVDLGGVEERDAALDGCADQGDQSPACPAPGP